MAEHDDRSSRGWGLLTSVLAVEVGAGVWLVWLTVQQFFASASEPLGQRLSLVLIVLGAFVWVTVTCAASFRRRAWARGSSLTLQVLLLAAAIGVLQGILGTMLVGSLMLVISLVGILASLRIRPAEYIAEKPDL